jgi:hypothetical protein
MVVPNQFIDRTQQRPQTFFGEGCVAHVSLADPFCSRLSQLVSEAAESSLPKGQALTSGWHLLVHGRTSVFHPCRERAVPELEMFSDRYDKSHRSAIGSRS